MKILLDEGVPNVIQRKLAHLSILTVADMGWRGVKNGKLVDLMVGEFDALITTDKNLSFQQNLEKKKLCAVILPTNKIPHVIRLLPKIERALDVIRAGESIELMM